uniref:Uncharacterized protein n=1 Tax=Acrobeloides nanus TaxID=290746 RepID=A0A914CHU5_9BILA
MTDYITLLLNPSAFYRHLDPTRQNQLLALLLDQSLISGDQSKKLMEIIDGLPKNVMMEFSELNSRSNRAEAEVRQQMEKLESQLSPSAKQILEAYRTNMADKEMSRTQCNCFAQHAFKHLPLNVQNEFEQFLNQYLSVIKQIFTRYGSQAPTQDDVQKANVYVQVAAPQGNMQSNSMNNMAQFDEANKYLNNAKNIINQLGKTNNKK